MPHDGWTWDSYPRSVVRVIRVMVSDLDRFIVSSQIAPGTIAHLYTARDLDDVG